MNYKYTNVSKVGLVREKNEDSLGVYETAGGLLAVVCDGLGGNKAGEVASGLAVETIYSLFTKSENENITGRIREAIIGANKAIYDKGISNPDFDGMSTTAEVLFLKNGKAYLGHIGDSRIYIFSDDKLTQLTKDHSLVQKLIDEGVLSQKEAEVHPKRNIITRALGNREPVEIDTDTLDLMPGNKIFFLCTDGVTAVIDNTELNEIFAVKNPELISSTISGNVEERGAPDNFSFIIINIE